MIGILSAYTLNNWQEVKNRNYEELEILEEIKSNLILDLTDLKSNMNAHQYALDCIDSLRNFDEYKFNDNRVAELISHTFRDYLFITHSGGFETLKSKGVDLVQNDSLRMKILSLYDFGFASMTYLEAEYTPAQFYGDYKYIVERYYDRYSLGGKTQIIKTKQSNSNWLKDAEVQIRIDHVQKEREFLLRFYNEVLSKVDATMQAIQMELKSRA